MSSFERAAVPVRETARVLLVDAERHVLLFEMQGPDAYDLIWITPGGQLNDGEEPEEAASRELHEETGLLIAPCELGRPVAVSEGSFRWKGEDVVASDVFFIYEHPRFKLDVSGHTRPEQDHYRRARWWSLDELTSTTEAVFPAGLDLLVRRFLTLGPPESPLVIPWTAE